MLYMYMFIRTLPIVLLPRERPAENPMTSQALVTPRMAPPLGEVPVRRGGIPGSGPLPGRLIGLSSVLLGLATVGTVATLLGVPERPFRADFPIFTVAVLAALGGFGVLWSGLVSLRRSPATSAQVDTRTRAGGALVLGTSLLVVAVLAVRRLAPVSADVSQRGVWMMGGLLACGGASIAADGFVRLARLCGPRRRLALLRWEPHPLRGALAAASRGEAPVAPAAQGGGARMQLGERLRALGIEPGLARRAGQDPEIQKWYESRRDWSTDDALRLLLWTRTGQPPR